jgi:XTP/dITP diphosphohydrolase
MQPGPRQFTGDTLVIASHNAGKVREIAHLLAPFVAHVPGAAELGLGEPDEIGVSFVQNAAIKARAAAAACGLPALADDSGVVVYGLGGAPGLYAARWAGPGKDFGVAMARIQTELAGNPDRRARFVAALAIAWPDGHVESVEGRWDGALTFPPRGANGFGYDPIFVPAGMSETCGEMDPAAKHDISHRADAFRKLVARCFQR